MKVQQHACNTHSSTQSSCRSEYEVSYGALDRQPSLSPPPPSYSDLSSTSWAHNTAAGSNSYRAIQSTAPSSTSRYHHYHHHSNHNNSSSNNNSSNNSSSDHRILHNVMGSSRVTKSIPQPTSRQAARYSSQPYHHPHQPIVASQQGASSFANQFHVQNGSMSQAPHPSEYRSSPYHIPRGNRLPTLVDRIKAALAVQPSRQSGMHASYNTDHSSSAYTSQPPSDYHSPSSTTPMPMPVIFPTPTLYGVRCTEVSQRAYSGQISAMKPGFDRLQRLDSGKVEYRTIAFCTHLTVSRWEAATASSAATATTTDSYEESAAATSAAPSSRNNPSHAAQLMSLANYIRHILSLTAGNTNAQPSQTAKNQPQKQESKQTSENSNNNAQELHTSNSRPLKAMSNRRHHHHRYSPDYHDHSSRHSRHHSDQPLQGLNDHGYREGHNNYDQQHSASPHFYPQQQQQPHHHHQHHHHSYQQQQDYSYPPAHRSESPSNTKPSDSSRHFPQPINTSRNSVPQELPKVPFPNLTLTLALIYVDRLKAKNPEAKGEPGCSHRLFLIAFIIAAKYRCSVSLSPSQETSTQSENSLFYDPPVVPEEDDESEEELSLETRLNAELIFSNHAWVRLLNLGSFARTPTSATNTGGSGPTGQTLPISSSGQQQQQQTPGSPMMSSVPPSPQVSETSTMASNTPVPTTPTQGHTPTQAQPLQSLSSIMHSSTGGASNANGSVGAAGTMLQVEDLDRMEAEFLTFLNFDLATMTHDLETCWNLLVGKKDV